ncbi:pyruvate:ferredoxin (flavodoxin) oxidoreductase [Photobacterium lipolyticum]|uniref:Pyruvate-flavodoxin oxidoreductase n=1 Tax=Photobacterium lipolyticum TaxID=266810 RepID=A0A2T3MZ18_9GAMM|nr:pyruvate:ferredoxin (flavodoxin) oxidoreductase [Photobacterium lipolyticum]PSW05227.1 pyruvate:ferredoxin (flavodoxin) oxidoreductase [Photobacterium lipolyticum]
MTDKTIHSSEAVLASKPVMHTCDGNEAAAHIAYRVSEVCAIYPITPSSTMAEFADQWAAEDKRNIWGNIPLIAEMQSEGGAAGTVHGSLQSGALTTTFTASQGLMLMLPNMYKIAGELTSAVFHVAARSLAAQGLSIFGDHQDIMAARGTGFALLAASSVQEAHDMALVAHAATLDARIPFIHFFDGFRTSHEVNKISLISDAHIREMISDELVRAHRDRGLSPDTPFIRGTAQNPDVYFQGRETVNPFYASTPDIVQGCMDKLGKLTGRHYKLIEFHGAPDAERVVIAMGSGVETIKETVEYLVAQGEKVGVLQVRLYRPLSAEHLLAALPKATKKLAILDRTKEPGANADPLYQDVLTALMDSYNSDRPDRLAQMPRLVAGRYGLSSKEFTPAMVKAVFDNLAKEQPKHHFTVGIIDDVMNSHLAYDADFDIESAEVVRAMFYGLGADGTVGANKNTIKIIGDDPDYFAQGYFVYDSKKSGSQTESHLRFGHHPINSPYLIQSANFIACHQSTFVENTDMLAKAADNATFLLNTTEPADKVWDSLPARMQQQLIDHSMTLYVIDAYKVARDTGMGNRINTIMQTCFFALSGVLEKDVAIAKIKTAIEKTYARKGPEVVKKNFAAVDHTLSHLYQVEVQDKVTATGVSKPTVSELAPKFVQEVTAAMMGGKGDLIPVSMLPVDGTYPSGTTQWEKRNIAQKIPVWEQDECIQCGNCSIVCPHAAIRAKFYDKSKLDDAPQGFKSAGITARGFPDTRYTLQVYAEDCTGCSLCVDACPMVVQEATETLPERKAINMELKAPYLEQEKQNLTFFETLAYNERARIDFSNVRGAQFLQPLFEFSGACAGCGETPYLKLMSQLFGDRMMVANATGCSSIYGGNLPTTPWSKNAEGRGPAWANSLFEDNAEFGFGFRLAAVKQHEMAKQLVVENRDRLDPLLVDQLLNADQNTETEIQAQIKRVNSLKTELKAFGTESALNLISVADQLIRRSIWIVGGDGWAYDIGSSGLDHVLASGADVNVLVMDTEVYSNTGGQMSKSTPLGAVAKFASAGKKAIKKDVAMQAISYNNVYVARVALGADPQQVLLAMREAEAYRGPSIIIAYSHCIAHGINMEDGLHQQQLAVKSGHWPLFRYNPALRDVGENPFSLDTLRPTIPLEAYRYNEGRYQSLRRSHPELAADITAQAQTVAERKWRLYEELATRPQGAIAPHVELEGK